MVADAHIDDAAGGPMTPMGPLNPPRAVLKKACALHVALADFGPQGGHSKAVMDKSGMGEVPRLLVNAETLWAGSVCFNPELDKVGPARYPVAETLAAMDDVGAPCCPSATQSEISEHIPDLLEHLQSEDRGGSEAEVADAAPDGKDHHPPLEAIPEMTEWFSTQFDLEQLSNLAAHCCCRTGRQTRPKRRSVWV
eukprot:TRINITY_DN60535_c0_g1_i1.p1 TRINITY_DN60535_c0_g1~~TRINITY_DN60535_c0_g1_i1.p1  ORF type:complete len:195 (-),score=33.23 TRINITY_DN60535_c0_g1_i1:327-911(-)